MSAATARLLWQSLLHLVSDTHVWIWPLDQARRLFPEQRPAPRRNCLILTIIARLLRSGGRPPVAVGHQELDDPT